MLPVIINIQRIIILRVVVDQMFTVLRYMSQHAGIHHGIIGALFAGPVQIICQFCVFQSGQSGIVFNSEAFRQPEGSLWSLNVTLSLLSDPVHSHKRIASKDLLPVVGSVTASLLREHIQTGFCPAKVFHEDQAICIRFFSIFDLKLFPFRIRC